MPAGRATRSRERVGSRRTISSAQTVLIVRAGTGGIDGVLAPDDQLIVGRADRPGHDHAGSNPGNAEGAGGESPPAQRKKCVKQRKLR